MLGIKVAPTREMIEGKQEHQNLYDQFEKEAVPATLEEMLLESKKVTVFSRELRVRDTKHGIYGLIDEVLLTPNEFIVIDDKPGTKTFLSNIHQVFGYCGSRNITYTRYANDMTFSSMSWERLIGLKAMVQRIVQEEGFALNEAKTRYMGRRTLLA